MTMTNNRPYIIRALYEWIADNDCTPYILVDSHWPGVMLPPQFAHEEKIVLNISPVAIRDLSMTNEHISFTTCFDSQTFAMDIPVKAILAIYAQENGQGMVFDPEPYPEEDSQSNKLNVVPNSRKKVMPSKSIPVKDTGVEKKTKDTKKKPALKIIK